MIAWNSVNLTRWRLSSRSVGRYLSLACKSRSDPEQQQPILNYSKSQIDNQIISNIFLSLMTRRQSSFSISSLKKFFKASIESLEIYVEADLREKPLDLL